MDADFMKSSVRLSIAAAPFRKNPPLPDANELGPVCVVHAGTIVRTGRPGTHLASPWP